MEKAINQILLDEQVGGKGRHFSTRFLQAGLVKYSFGVCLLEKETIDKFIYNFVGCPVIINHKDVTNESAKDDRVGVISRVWFNEQDGWYWGEGVIFEQEALDLIDKGYNVSCQYEISEYSTNGGIHNGNDYDKVILNGKPEHLAIVKNPRYENAMIAVNAMEIDEMDLEAINGGEGSGDVLTADNDFVTLDETDENGDRIVIWIPGNVISGKVLDRVRTATKDFKQGSETKFDFSHTRVKPSDEQVKYLKDTLKEIEDKYKFKGVAQIEISSELNKGSLGVCFLPNNTSLISLSPQLYNGKYSQEKYEKGVKSGWNPKGTGEMVKSVLVHELGHAITVNSKDEKFWNKIDKVRGEYLKNIKKTDIKNPDFISNYARTNKYEFVAEAFCQGHLAKKYGKYTKQVMDIISEHFSSTSQLKLAGINKAEDNNSNDDMWVEGFGYGYPMDEETYEEWKKEQKQEQKEDSKKAKAKNDIMQAINELKETDMFKNLFRKRSKTMDREEMKDLFMECLTDLTASNEKEVIEDEEVKEEVAENKCKNKEEELDYKKLYNELKAKVDAKEKEDAETAKAKNSIEEQKEMLLSGKVETKVDFITQSRARELGKELF